MVISTSNPLALGVKVTLAASITLVTHGSSTDSNSPFTNCLIKLVLTLGRRLDLAAVYQTTKYCQEELQ